MDPSLYDLVQKILWGVGFIAIGGAMVLKQIAQHLQKEQQNPKEKS